MKRTLLLSIKPSLGFWTLGIIYGLPILIQKLIIKSSKSAKDKSKNNTNYIIDKQISH